MQNFPAAHAVRGHRWSVSKTEDGDVEKESWMEVDVSKENVRARKPSKLQNKVRVKVNW